MRPEIFAELAASAGASCLHLSILWLPAALCASEALTSPTPLPSAKLCQTNSSGRKTPRRPSGRIDVGFGPFCPRLRSADHHRISASFCPTAVLSGCRIQGLSSVSVGLGVIGSWCVGTCVWTEEIEIPKSEHLHLLVEAPAFPEIPNPEPQTLNLKALNLSSILEILQFLEALKPKSRSL